MPVKTRCEVRGKLVPCPVEPDFEPPPLTLAARARVRQIRKAIRATHPDSPLLPYVDDMVRWGLYFDIDPRLIAAIAGQETEYGTTGRAEKIHNAWGYGPHWDFGSWDHAVYRIARALKLFYVDEGYDTIREIGRKWAPSGAANDPTGLNEHWYGGVKSLYRKMGGKRYPDA